MVGIGLDLPKPGSADGFDLNGFAQRSLDEVGGPGKKLVDIEQLRIERLTPRERQQATRQSGSSLRPTHCVTQSAIEPGIRGLLGSLMLRGFKIADYDHEQIVKVVGDAAAQLPDRLHLL